MRLSQLAVMCALLCAVVFGTAQITFANYKTLPLSRLVSQAEVIARIRVISTEKRYEAPPIAGLFILGKDGQGCHPDLWMQPNSLTMLALSVNGSPGLSVCWLPVRRARMSVDRVFKGNGINPGAIIDVAFDTGGGCPNALYKDGQDMIVFLIRGKSGFYETLNFDNGQKTIRSDADYRRWAAQIQREINESSVLWLVAPSFAATDFLTTRADFWRSDIPEATFPADPA